MENCAPASKELPMGVELVGVTPFISCYERSFLPVKELRFRQIHLDYHTSEKIPGIGSKFNAEEFISVLQDAAVDSITVFSRCHHGMIYHDTKFPAKHP